MNLTLKLNNAELFGAGQPDDGELWYANTNYNYEGTDLALGSHGLERNICGDKIQVMKDGTNLIIHVYEPHTGSLIYNSITVNKWSNQGANHQ